MLKPESYNSNLSLCVLHTTQQLADFEVIVDAGKVDRFCEFVTCHNSNDPNKLVSKPRVLVEVFYTGVYAGIEKKKIQSTVQEMLDPQSYCL